MQEALEIEVRRRGVAGSIALVAIALIGAAASPVARANHQDGYVDTNRDGVLAPPDPILDSDGDGASNYDDACPYDPRPSYYAGPAGPPAPPGQCWAFEDNDADRYIAAQDPCDGIADNARCDTDGDGEPDVYDDCPQQATVHMLGQPTTPGLPIRTCDEPSDSIEAYMEAWGTALPLGDGLHTKVPPKRADKRRNLKAIPLEVTCSVACDVQLSLVIRGARIAGSGFAAIPAGSTTVSLKVNPVGRREYRKRGALKGVVTLTSAAPGADPSAASAAPMQLRLNDDGLALTALPGAGAKRATAARPVLESSYDILTEHAYAAASKFAGIADQVAKARGCSANVNEISVATPVLGPADEAASLSFGGSDPCAVPRQYATFARALFQAAQTGQNVRASYAVTEEARKFGAIVCHQFLAVNGTWVAHAIVAPPQAANEGCL